MSDPREYGQHHEPESPPLMRVTLGSFPRSKNYRAFGPFREFDAPVPGSLLRQRAGINTRAHELGQQARRVRENGGPIAPRPPALGLERLSGRCPSGFDVRTQHPWLCRCEATA